MECRLLQTVELGSHTQFIGEIVDIKVEDDALDEKGIISSEKVLPFVFSASDRSYYRIGDQIGQAFSMGMKFKI